MRRPLTSPLRLPLLLLSIAAALSLALLPTAGAFLPSSPSPLAAAVQQQRQRAPPASAPTTVVVNAAADGDVR